MTATSSTGRCDTKFARVKEAFAVVLARPFELGAAVAVFVDGRPVVDLWGGWVDAKKTRPWAEDTVVNVFSTTKGLLALGVHRLVEEGRVDLDAPVARVWPELDPRITLRMILAHRAGLPAVRAPLPPEALFDWGAMTAALAAQEPWWEPGTAHGYHAVTFGWLLGEVVRRVTGKMPREYLAEAITGPLAADFQIGLRPADEERCADLRPTRREPGVETLFDRIARDPESMTAKAFVNPPTMVLPGTVSSRPWRDADLPSVNGHATARGIARIYGAVARGGELDGVRILSPESIARCQAEQSRGEDRILGVPTRFSLGFMLPQPTHDPFAAEGAFGHPGAGGSMGFADPEARLSFGFVMNRSGNEILSDPRVRALSEAVYASLRA
ncbi:MAG: beta-lactamase family protein [Deltaproteobacteria bacterium]|nr:beta-lactamase family protein [Deltaproteobacteria bacterium]